MSERSLTITSPCSHERLQSTNWNYNTAERKQSQRFPERVEDNFLTQLVSETTREGINAGLLFAN